ncbi:hypothetical protein J2Z53_001710 [Clostridium moniliforme]|uniref:Uncharacterized protein n=1 Tax=Clostridium moniliforme TaxID=39489 RepID=A0ABS4F1J8_9CLOT|nr:hypothetical protein [Clostridium moniliforme]MBP1890126.1 hypothetical protein [Clostridium moniliforme]
MNKKFNNYSFWRIKRILETEYKYRLEKVSQGYKANRKPNYVKIYNLIDNNTNSIILESITLNSLRKVLTEENYFLND